VDVRLDESTALAELRTLMGALPDGTVFGQPVERDGVTVVPAARVRFGGGEGRGEKPGQGERGSGHGYAGWVVPVGAFVIADGTVRWVPAADAQRINAGWQAVTAVGIVVAGSTLRRIFKRGA